MSERAERGWVIAAALGGALVVVAVLAIAGVFDAGDSEPAADDFGAAVTVPEPSAPQQPSVKRIEVGGARTRSPPAPASSGSPTRWRAR